MKNKFMVYQAHSIFLASLNVLISFAPTYINPWDKSEVSSSTLKIPNFIFIWSFV